MQFFWTSAPNGTPSRLLRVLIEIHRVLPGRIAERVSWRLNTLVTAAFRKAVPGAPGSVMYAKWGHQVRFKGTGDLRFLGGFYIDSNVFFEIDGSVEFGHNVVIERWTTIKAFRNRLVAGENVYVGPGCHLDAMGGLTIGDDTIIGPGAKIISFNHGMRAGLPYREQPPTEKGIAIGKNVWIGAGAIVLDGITIGDNAIVGAGAVVTRDVEPNAIVVGNPARKLRSVSGDDLDRFRAEKRTLDDVIAEARG